MTAQTHHSLVHFCSARVNEACKLWLLEGLGAEGLKAVHLLINLKLDAPVVEKHLIHNYPEEIRAAITHGLDTYRPLIEWEAKNSQKAGRYLCIAELYLRKPMRDPAAFAKVVARNLGVSLDLAAGLRHFEKELKSI